MTARTDNLVILSIGLPPSSLVTRHDTCIQEKYHSCRVELLTIHGLKNTHGSQMPEAKGCDLKAVQERLRHASITAIAVRALACL